MLDPKEIQRVIDRSDIVIECLSKWGITFKIPMIRCQVAALGYQVVWNGLSREEATIQLLEIGFDNLTLVQIMDAFVRISRQIEESREKTKLRPLLSPTKRIAWKESIKARVRAGKF